MRRSRFVLLALVLSLLLCSCSFGPQRYQKTYFTLFDTVTNITAFAESQAAFDETAQQVHDTLLRYHRLFDIYNDYEGLNNLKTVNDNAGVQPVTVDKAIIDLLLDCKDYYALTGGRVNVAMGSVLQLWHEARSAGLDDPENASLPNMDALREAATHTSWDSVIIDEAASTVYLSDPAMRLDVGAVAKGWACQRAAEAAPAGMLLTVGGNVCATGPKDEKGTPWLVGVSDPEDPNGYLLALQLTNAAIVTSGDYQRYYTVDGEIYHHIIDPDTLFPAAYWRSVTIVCGDSGLADALSTALFLLPQAEGQALLEQTGAMAMWVDTQGKQLYSPGFQALINE